MNELIVLLDGRKAGRVLRKGDRLQFVYDDDWRRSDQAYPLSLSMPLAAGTHGHREIHAFLWGLLPDNDRILERWAREFHVSARNVFGLIGNVGEDCAGAVQFVRPERLEEIEHGGTVEWLDEIEIAKRLDSTLTDASTGRTAQDNGQFSLAGAQPKTALLLFGERWGVPSGRIPTTHILKPPSRSLPGHSENEHLCLRLAASLGLRTADSRILFFNDRPAICVTRYDRYLPDDANDPADIVRIHQEDMCQAYAIHPERKYQNEGGPGPVDILRLIRDSSSDPYRRGLDPSGAFEDSWSFVDGLLFNWIIGGTDAHAKNYSFLLAPRLVRLAPLYDIASAFGVEDLPPQRIKLAMKIGGHYRLENIALRHWEAWAKTAGLSDEAIVARIREMCMQLPDAVRAVSRKMKEEGLNHPIVDRLTDNLTKRANRIGAM
jgi:serine/threonine-protein kinase HipA